MSRSSEDILLTVHHVKHKKNDGILFLMSERIGWMIGNRDVFSLHHKYTDIKSQKISPEGKPKVQLQIVLHDGSNTTFHFVNPAGRGAQIADRDAAKDLLLQLLPKFKKKMNKELEDKNRKLSESPSLLQLYKDLVSTNILTADEFWARHGKSGLSNSNSVPDNQEVGVSGSFLGEIKPQADGANGLKYNLTGDIIQSIFKTYPAVKKKHTENVPQFLSEQEFWTKFFQSHYFHRDRIIGKGVKDLFTECAKDDDKRIKAALTSGVNDIVADISKFDDTSLDPHYGCKDNSKSQANFVHQNIIKRFNHHSIMVMNVSNGNTDASPSAMSKRLKEKIEYEDLSQDEPHIKIAKLSLTKPERYLNGPTPVLSSSYSTSDELFRSRKLLAESLRTWKNSRPANVLTASKAVSTLTDLTPGGALMKGSQNQALAESCPEAVQQDLKQIYISLGELLRHFWACFPPTTPSLQEKATKMFETLKKFERVKIRPFENELVRNYNSAAKMTIHINRMLDAAYRKHTTWAQKAKLN